MGCVVKTSGKPLRASLVGRFDPSREQRLWAGVQTRQDRRRVRRAIGSGALALSMLALALVVGMRWLDPGALTLADGSPIARARAVESTRTLELSDGSVIALLAGTEIAPGRNDGSHFDLTLLEGDGSFWVVPDGPRRWRIDTTLGVVEVVGTIFRVHATSDVLDVEVEHGRVQVTSDYLSPEHVRSLGPGERVHIERPRVASSDSAGPPSAAPEGTLPAVESDPSPEGPVPVAHASTPRTSRAPARSWRQAADDGRYDEAYSLALPEIDEVTAHGSADDLLSLADAARLSGHSRAAVDPLERLLARFPGTPEAGLGAVTLARLEMDVLHRPERAIDALDHTRGLAIPTALRDEVDARRFEALEAAGHHERAVIEARHYLELHETGRFAARAAAISSAP